MKDIINRLHRVGYSNEMIARELGIKVSEFKEIKKQRPNLPKKTYLKLKNIMINYNLKRKQENE